ncbi:hypothetical protein P5E37_05740 [Vibrio parahaemolyticus]|nr:hypothetical protein [Vibrio parahaemolyticus]
MYLAKIEKDSANKISELVESLNGYKRQSEPLKFDDNGNQKFYALFNATSEYNYLDHIHMTVFGCVYEECEQCIFISFAVINDYLQKIDISACEGELIGFAKSCLEGQESALEILSSQVKDDIENHLIKFKIESGA